MDSDAIWIEFMEIGAKMGCHQRADRSFYFKNYQFPLCARCTGIMAGTIFTYLYGRKLRIPIWLCCLFIAVMSVDGMIQYLKVMESTNIRRLFTGIMAGIGATYLRLEILKNCMNKIK